MPGKAAALNLNLLVRSGRGYELTPVALGLADPVRVVIMTVERAITGRDGFDPAPAAAKSG
jgi:DNA-binding transcriptional LysR family regulator